MSVADLQARQLQQAENYRQGLHNPHPDAQWFPQGGLGLFIHWGLASVHGDGDLSWAMLARKPWVDGTLTPNAYWGLADNWNADRVDYDKMLAEAKAAGFAYAVMVAKHHDGFTLWPSAFGDMGTAKTFGGRDFVKEFVTACRKHGLKAGLYYSPPDWRFDRRYRSFAWAGPAVGMDHEPVTLPPKPAGHDAERAAQVRGQVGELLTRYGKIDLIWFDGGHGEISNDVVRKMQPGIVINNRNGAGDYGDSESSLPSKRFGNMWFETCIPCWPKREWSYAKGYGGYDAPTTLAMLVMLRAWGGNLLANVGPKGDGALPDGTSACWAEMAAWMKHSRESVTGVIPGPWPEKANMPVTRANGVAYIHFLPKIAEKTTGVPSDVPDWKTMRRQLPCYPWDSWSDTAVWKDAPLPERAILLRTGEAIPFRHENGTLTVSIPAHLRTGVVDVVKLEFPKPAPDSPAPSARSEKTPGAVAVLEPGPIPAQVKGCVHAADFGILPDTGKDVGPALSRLLAAAAPGSEIVLEKGVYEVWRANTVQRPWQQSNSDLQSTRHYGILMEHLRGVTLDGNGSDFVFHGTQTGIGLAFCSDMKLKNFTMDWRRPEMSQGLVLESGDDFAVVRMHPDTPAKVKNGQLVFVGEGWEIPCGVTMEWDPQTGGSAYRRRDLGGPGAATEVAAGVFRFETKQKYQVGHAVLFRHGPRSHAAMLVHGCANTSVEKVDAYASCGLGLLAQHSEHVRIDGFRYIPKPGSGRLFSSRDDGLQVSCCKGLVRVEHCVFEGMMDDPVNVHGFYLPVTQRIDDRTLRLRLPNNQGQKEWGEAGERVEYILADSLQGRGGNRIASFKLLNDNEAELRLEQPVPAEIGAGWVLDNMDRHPSVVIRDSRFGNQRARGVLVTTPRPVLIENNVFYTSGSAILINGDVQFWHESGAARDVVIRGNTFVNCNHTNYQFCNGVINIEPVVKKPQDGFYVHGNIRIEKNLFKTFDAPVLYAQSVDGLTFGGNVIERTHDYAPWRGDKAAVTLERCRNVDIRGTRLVGDVLGPFVAAPHAEGLRIDAGDGLKAAGK